MNKTLKHVNDAILILITFISGFLFYADWKYVSGNLGEGAFTEFDYTFYRTLNPNEEGAGVWRLFTNLASSKFTICVTVVALVVFGLLMILKKIKCSKENWIDLTITSLATLFTCGILGELILKNIFKRPRPDVLLLTKITGYSFPSNHTACAVVFYWMLGDVLSHLVKKFERRHGEQKKTVILLRILLYLYGIIALIIPLMVGYSRIYLGAHFATDVFGGFVYGIIMYLIFTKIYRIIIK